MKKICALTLALTILLTLGGCTMSEYQMNYSGLALPSSEEVAAMNSNELLTTPGGAYSQYAGGAIFANRELAENKGLTFYQRSEEDKQLSSESIIKNQTEDTQSLSTAEDFPEYQCLSEKYFFIQSLYQKVLEEYLAQELDLEKIDKKIQKNSHNFHPLEEDQQYYQRHSMLDLNFIFLRNTIFIERLSQEDIGILLKYYDQNETEITDELRELVKRTYPYVLAPVDTQLYPDVYSFSYGAGPGEVFTMDTIVFGISITNPYDSTGENQLIDKEEYQEDYLYLKEKLVPTFIKELEGKLGENVSFGFIVYDE